MTCQRKIPALKKLLEKQGYITLEDIYKHCQPFRDLKRKELKGRIWGLGTEVEDILEEIGVGNIYSVVMDSEGVRVLERGYVVKASPHLRHALTWILNQSELKCHES